MINNRKYFPVDLIAKLKTTYHIFCDNCNKEETMYNLDDYTSAALFFQHGWRVTKFNNCYCPRCAKSKLKLK